MDTFVIITIIGAFLSILALKFIIEPEELKAIAQDLTRNHGLMMVAGLIPLIMGLVILGLYPPLEQSQAHGMIVAGFGGILFAIGIFRLLFRSLWINMVSQFSPEMKHTRIIMSLMLIIGLSLMAAGLQII